MTMSARWADGGYFMRPSPLAGSIWWLYWLTQLRAGTRRIAEQVMVMAVPVHW
jgi:hypothetical protein